MNDTRVWFSQLQLELGRCGAQGQAAMQFLTERRVELAVHDQPTGARWTLNRNIQLHPRCLEYDPGDPYPMSLVVHEVRHLEQGFFTALSVYGELDAWHIQFSFIKSLAGRVHRDPDKSVILEDLMSLDLNWDRKMLAKARGLMRSYAGNTYRVDLLPLYPLPREILFRVTRRSPASRN